jgi:methylated-DNA-[protein]-cysteine S-methyltransferase
MKLFLSPLDCPLGAMLLVTDAQQVVRALDFADHTSRLHRGLREHHGEVELFETPFPAEMAQPIARYFDGELEALNVLRTATAGSELQRRVWAALHRKRWLPEHEKALAPKEAAPQTAMLPGF